MSKFAALFSGTGVTVGAGATLVGALAVAGYVSGAFSPESEAPVTTALVPEPEVAAPSVLKEPKGADVVDQDPEDVARKLQTPSFDVVRVETDGAAMIAGSAEAGSTIEIKLDNSVVAKVQADRTGKFASFVTLPESNDARVLTLDAGAKQTSKERVIIAPVAAPKVKVVENVVKPVEEVVAVAKPAVEAAVAESVIAPKVADTVVAEEVEVASTPQKALAEPTLPVVLLATDEGVRVLQSPQAPKPDAMTSLLASISYDDAGDVSLTGSGGGEFVRVYLNNRPVATSQIASSGDWQAGLPSVDTGIYTLRVDELNEAGDVVTRVETPFKRETPEILAAATKSEKLVQAVTVQPGATLWAIAQEKYGSGTLYARVVAANADTIKDPNLIYPGQVFTVPD